MNENPQGPAPESMEGQLARLQAKYAGMGQDMAAYLEGLLHARSLSYWEYLHIDTLLTLQKPRTDIPDEMVFIGYHQITELYFRLMLHELEQLPAADAPSAAEGLALRLRRLNAYARNLVASFEVMEQGMDHKQFLDFRMALLPASGFQSAQFRQLELALAGPERLLSANCRAAGLALEAPEAQYEHSYWKEGNRELATGEKTLTLRMFEEKYDAELRAFAATAARQSLRAHWLALPQGERFAPHLVSELRSLDSALNVHWKLAHFKSSARYLQRRPEDIKATGGTNWQKYLPPRFQQIIFFPEVWTEAERTDWGRAWVREVVGPTQVPEPRQGKGEEAN